MAGGDNESNQIATKLSGSVYHLRIEQPEALIGHVSVGGFLAESSHVFTWVRVKCSTMGVDVVRLHSVRPSNEKRDD